MHDACFTLDTTAACYYCDGQWTTHHLEAISKSFKYTPLVGKNAVKISGKRLKQFDSAGALALLIYVQKFKQTYSECELIDFTPEQNRLLTLVDKNMPSDQASAKENESTPHSLLETIGQLTFEKLTQVDGFTMLIGDLVDKLFLAAGNWKRLQLPSIITNIRNTGIQALPILALLSFLIGVVLAYQMGLQLETYGANVFIAYLSGMAIFREFGPLITAIIVAGRTSSSFTAQIGSMKINEELDALHTMGLSPTELLVVPKVLGLTLVFPLIIFWSDLFSILGAMLMSKFMLGIGYVDFLTRIQDSVGLKQMMLGLYKAPAFSILIALVGCFQGFRVELKADSVGSQTTKSVVQALFLIIITDATYSIIYSWLDL